MYWLLVADILVGEAFTEKNIYSSWKQRKQYRTCRAQWSGREGLCGRVGVAARGLTHGIEVQEHFPSQCP